MTTNTEPAFPTRQVVKIGTGLKTAYDFIDTLEGDGCITGDKARLMLSLPSFKVSPAETEVELVEVSAEDLGFKVDATYGDIYARANALGLSCCHHEVGPQFLLQYGHLSASERLLVGMEPIADSNGHLHIFSVLCGDDGRRWLWNYWVGPKAFMDASFRWLFERTTAPK